MLRIEGATPGATLNPTPGATPRQRPANGGATLSPYTPGVAPALRGGVHACLACIVPCIIAPCTFMQLVVVNLTDATVPMPGFWAGGPNGGVGFSCPSPKFRGVF